MFIYFFKLLICNLYKNIDYVILHVSVIDDKVIAAQAFLFFLAGFETSSTTMTFAMYELAANPKIQEKLYDEIRAAFEKHGCLSYDIISEMKYLDCIVRGKFLPE